MDGASMIEHLGMAQAPAGIGAVASRTLVVGQSERECKPLGTTSGCVSGTVMPGMSFPAGAAKKTGNAFGLWCLQIVLHWQLVPPKETETPQHGLLESLSGISKIGLHNPAALSLWQSHTRQARKPSP